MKTIKQFSFALVLALVTTLSSCSSDSSSGGGTSAALGTLKAKVAGSNFASMTEATFATKQVMGSTTNFTIQGSDATGKAIQIMVMGTDGAPGTFEISDTAGISVIASYTEINLSTFTSQTWAAPYEESGVVGSVTISEVTDTNIKGTFTFTGKNQDGADTKQVTNGAFNINFSS